MDITERVSVEVFAVEMTADYYMERIKLLMMNRTDT